MLWLSWQLINWLLGRRIYLRGLIPEKVGGLNNVLDKISNNDTGIKILSIKHNRERPDIPLNMTLLVLELEVTPNGGYHKLKIYRFLMNFRKIKC